MMVREPEDRGVTNTQRVADQLRREILDGAISPGSRLRAEAVAERYGVSRTPAREAFLLLAQEGLLEIVPRRGAVVRPFDERDLFELYELRSLLEPLAARRAATRISPGEVARLDELCERQEALGGEPDEVAEHIARNAEFHEVIIRAAGSRRLLAALAQVEGLPAGFRTRFWRDDEQRRQSLMCHRALINAFRAADPSFAETVMRMHHQAAMVLVESHDEHDGRRAADAPTTDADAS